MPTYKGALYVETKGWNYTQDSGLQHSIIARGRQFEIESKRDALVGGGYDVAVNQGPAYWTLNASRNYWWEESPYVERWTLTTEIIEKDLFSHPEVMAEMYAYSDGAAKYKKRIEDAIANGDTITASPSWLIKELSRGVEGYEHEYHVLSRTTTFDRLAGDQLPSPFNMRLILSRQILSSSQLAAEQNIPADVLFSLPADRGSSTDDAKKVQWGWRVREQKAEIDTSTMGSFQMSWTYAAWSTFIYQKYT